MKNSTMKALLLLIATGFLAAVVVYYYFILSFDGKTERQVVTTNIEEKAEFIGPVRVATVAEEKVVTFAIAGDMMLDRDVWHSFKKIGLEKIFDNFDLSIFKNADLSLLNLEGPISKTAINDDWRSNNLVFNFPPESLGLLKFMGVKAVSLANNHSYNAGRDGFAYTQQVLRQNGISNFGRQIGFVPAEDVYRYDGDLKISVIGLDVLAGSVDDQIVNQIKQEREEGRIVVMMPHWGTEYRSIHNDSQQALAAKWIDAGANLIVGSHPHVVEDFEVINGVPVIYSLGNFVFDQYFSKLTQQGLILTGKIFEHRIELTFNPIEENKVRPSVVTGDEKNSRISRIFNINSAEGFTKIDDATIEIDF